MSGVDEPGLPTLFEWAGGLDPLRRMIDTFYDHVEEDPDLSPFFPDGVSEHHRAHVADWWAEVLGGPAAYTEQHGGYDAMLTHHLDLSITASQRRAFAATMSLAADEAGLPADPEFRAAIIGYLEWGTRLAAENSQLGATPFEHAPVPRWGWGVAPPYLG
ncbi:MAG TPA: group II truncated hemoglobin [Marmoricola sp.]|nr:group II truncated hemoglobin [Marmoricola sp.]